MTRRDLWMLAVVIVLVGTSALLLGNWKRNQSLGTPGVRMVAVPSVGPNGEPVGEESVQLPEEVAGFRSQADPVSDSELSWLPKDTCYGKRLYVGPDGFWAKTSVVVMGTDRGSIHKPQFCLVGQGWTIEESEVAQVPIRRPHPYQLDVMRLTASKTVENKRGQRETWRGLYIYWFVADGQMTPHHGERMWWMARDMLLQGVLQRWAYISYFTACRPGEEEAALERLEGFIAATVPDFQLVAGGPAVKQEAQVREHDRQVPELGCREERWSAGAAIVAGANATATPGPGAVVGPAAPEGTHLHPQRLVLSKFARRSGSHLGCRCRGILPRAKAQPTAVERPLKTGGRDAAVTGSQDGRRYIADHRIRA